MSDTRYLQEFSEELRARVAALEPSTRARPEIRTGPAPDPKEMMANLVISEFFDHPRIMLVIADLVEARFLRVNRTMGDVLGINDSDLLEVSFLDLVHPDDRKRTLLEIGRLVAGKRTSGFTNRYLSAHGTYRVFEWVAIADDDRELCFAMAIDITEDPQ
jgi:PAS domain S-box-containing protein